MQELEINIHKWSAFNTIIKNAHKKSQEIHQRQDENSEELLFCLIMIIDDAAQKISNIRWTDNYGLHQGIKIYSRAIENL
jgi:hypothetical protein